MSETYSLSELNAYLKQVIALNFPEPIWLRAEIAQQNVSRGHRYLELVEKESSGTIRAQSSAVLWRGTGAALARRPGLQPAALLQAGREVRLQVRVDFHERYGLKLVVQDVDPAFTLGKLEQQRQETLARLQAMGLLDLNARLPLPMVVQRLAVISSPTAAGWADFRHQLQTNPQGYAFRLHLFPSALQGERVEPEMLGQLEAIRGRREEFDAVVIIRGGGSRLDLAAFDGFELCRAVAECPLPVLSGIGHEVDRTVLDGVAHSSLKTPTAVAEFLLERSLVFESRLLEAGRAAQRAAGRQLEGREHRLREWRFRLARTGERRLREAERLLTYIRDRLAGASRDRLQLAGQELMLLEKEVDSRDPERAFEKGFALLLKGGRWLRSAGETEPGDQLQARLSDGSLGVRVEEKHRPPDTP